MQMVFRVVDSFDLKILNNYLSAGCKIINVINMPFAMAELQMNKTNTIAVHGGWTDYVLEMTEKQRKELQNGSAISASKRSN